MWVPDNVADWDGPDHHEVERFQSFRRHLRWGDTFLDVGTEHGWIAALIGREFVGPENMVLCEPTPEFWTNIRRTWECNDLKPPLACWPGFVGRNNGFSSYRLERAWPIESNRVTETPAMPYASLLDDEARPETTIDEIAGLLAPPIRALNIDVEGAELLVLKGAVCTLVNEDEGPRNVWVSIHPEMMKAYGHAPELLHGFMAGCGWKGEHLATDHEEHWHYTRR